MLTVAYYIINIRDSVHEVCAQGSLGLASLPSLTASWCLSSPATNRGLPSFHTASWSPGQAPKGTLHVLTFYMYIDNDYHFSILGSQLIKVSPLR